MPRMVRHVDGPSCLSGWRGITSLEKQSIDISRLCWQTEKPGGLSHQGDASGRWHRSFAWPPTPQVCYTCEDIWSWPDAEGQDHIDMKGRTSFKTRQPAILCIDWYNVVCICTSNFAIREPRPSRMSAVISSTSMLCRGKCSPAILLLTLWPAGLDRSRMRRHFPGWWRLT